MNLTPYACYVNLIIQNSFFFLKQKFIPWQCQLRSLWFECLAIQAWQKDEEEGQRAEYEHKNGHPSALNDAARLCKSLLLQVGSVFWNRQIAPSASLGANKTPPPIHKHTHIPQSCHGLQWNEEPDMTDLQMGVIIGSPHPTHTLISPYPNFCAVHY